MIDRPQRQHSTAYALVFAAALPELQAIAYECGYALGVHGSMSTDFDLIACPWTEEAVSADRLIEAIQERTGCHTRLLLGHEIDHNPATKPHGRQAYAFYFSKTKDGTSYGPYLDISVMPRICSVEA